MNRDDIIRMAKEAGIASDSEYLVPHDNVIDGLKRFANLVAASEREACAKLCEQYETGSPEYYAETLARAIRARSQ